ncbi:MAG: DUF6941 family protein [Acidimicrobiia bacterium]
MRVTMLLCDAAQVSDGKLYILGGGWSVTGPDPAPSAVAIKLEVDWHEAGTPHHWELFLVDADGRPASFQTAEGAQMIEIRGDFEVGRPEGASSAPRSTPVGRVDEARAARRLVPTWDARPPG